MSNIWPPTLSFTTVDDLLVGGLIDVSVLSPKPLVIMVHRLFFCQKLITSNWKIWAQSASHDLGKNVYPDKSICQQIQSGVIWF